MKTITPSLLWKQLFSKINIIALLLFVPHSSSEAQTIVSPATSDIFLSSFTTSEPNINCDMISFPSSTNKLMAITWDSPTGIEVRVQDLMGNSSSVTIPNGKFGDIVLGKHMTNYNDLAGVVFLLNDMVYLNTYNIIINPISGSISLSLNGSYLLSGAPALGCYPHIDMFVDILSGMPALHKFVISYGRANALGGNSIYAVHGELFNPMATMVGPILISSSANFMFSDVAASNDGALTNTAYFALSSYTPTSLDVAKLDCSTGAPSVPVVSPLAANHSYFPRIEAIGTTVGTVNNPWTIIAPDDAWPNRNVWVYNNSNLGGIDCTSPYFPGEENWLVAISSGSLIFSPSPIPYTIGWNIANFGINVTQEMNFTSGTVTTPGTFYQVNSIPIPVPAGKVTLALSNCSNFGDGLLTAWYTGPYGNVYYKYTNDVLGYKPTNITKIENRVPISVSPNPASNFINIEGIDDTEFKISDIKGSTVLSGRLAISDHKIDISRLTKGMYIVHLTGHDKSNKLKFIKN